MRVRAMKPTCQVLAATLAVVLLPAALYAPKGHVGAEALAAGSTESTDEKPRHISDIPHIPHVPEATHRRPSEAEELIGADQPYPSDRELVPIVKVSPIYPRGAQSSAQSPGISGHVLLQFTVTATGTVRDPVVVEAKPPGIFDRAAIDAALQFKYKPKVVNGEPVEVAGVRNLIRFELQE